jgi:hypothetical protein
MAGQQRKALLTDELKAMIVAAEGFSIATFAAARP